MLRFQQLAILIALTFSTSCQAPTDDRKKPETIGDKEGWTHAAAAIRSSSQYGGLELQPQDGLVPLGVDPHSQLHEFLHLGTHEGEIPQRDEKGQLSVSGKTGIIFVLIPKGRFWMGSQSSTPNGQNYDPYALPQDTVKEIAIEAPFFLSKYEMTRGQWQRSPADVKMPSKQGPGVDRTEPQFQDPADLTQPVGHVTWQTCATTVARMGLRLPTEEEWEYAARAGTSTPWVGNTSTVEGIARWGNIADGDHKGFPSNSGTLADGYAGQAPVGQFQANGFGLYDVLGNAWEWTSTPQLNRGGSFLGAAHFARVAYSGGRAADHRGIGLGLRPARRVHTD
ncbi:MAG: formylglycine-generating enzyme family protein [Planctomycetota bacterium]